MSISFSFDIGHSSIGWAALNVSGKDPKILGCGAVVFPAEDCQNQQRATFRRQRRHIAATRNRIRRLERYLEALGMLSSGDVSACREQPHPWPWLLAARVLRNGHVLNWKELWAVIRWYAHNRGYDGNALWAGDDSDPEDVKKVQAARELMDRFDANTMCETVCALLDVDPADEKNPRLAHYFKGENAAFPRAVVEDEVKQILEAHLTQLSGVTEAFIKSLLVDWKVANSLGFNAKLPPRYCGGLLFGQLKPRFENRIIPTCRITGKKTSSKHSRAFYRYRWAMLINNLRVEDATVGQASRPLTADERVKLNAVMEEAGFLGKASLAQAMKKSLKLVPTNLQAMFLIPEMEHALTLDPAQREMNGKLFKPVWEKIPMTWKGLFLNQLFHQRNYQGAPPSWSQWRARMVAKDELPEEFDDALRTVWEGENKQLAKKKLSISFPQFCDRPIRISSRHIASGRSPYAQSKLIEACEWVMRGEDPRSIGGPLEETESIRNARRDQEVDQNSNNHLVRHRLKIFKRTLADLVKRFADGDASRVSSVGIEVVRDIVQFSGKTAKEKAQLLGQQLWHHRKVSKMLEEKRAEVGGSWEITPGLIKKVRIADDLDWTCPYTGKPYCLNQIIHREVDREHIIPRSKRPTDAMHALVLTFRSINKEKGARTAMQFIEDTEGSDHTFTPQRFQEYVSKLKRKNGPSKDDENRCMKRKIALLTRDYEVRGKAKAADEAERVDGFTEGSLTQTSYLNKLAAQQASHWFAKELPDGSKLPAVFQLSGSVTGAARNGWDLFDQLNEACPETRGKIKTEIREITHLHHALDAIILGLAGHYFPKDGRVWAMLSKRRIGNPSDQAYMRERLGELISFSADGKWAIQPLSPDIRSQIVKRLQENRVVRHNPRTMRGLKVQQNVWRVEAEDPDDPSKMLIRMRPRNEEGQKISKHKSERKSKLFGTTPRDVTGKLKKLKGAIIVEDNYGVALDPEPKVIPYEQVWKQVQDLKKANGNRPIRILRNGDVFSVPEGRYAGTWRVHSIKDANMGLVLDIASPEVVRVQNKSDKAKINVLLNTLLKNGLVLAKGDLAGTPR